MLKTCLSLRKILGPIGSEPSLGLTIEKCGSLLNNTISSRRVYFDNFFESNSSRSISFDLFRHLFPVDRCEMLFRLQFRNPFLLLLNLEEDGDAGITRRRQLEYSSAHFQFPDPNIPRPLYIYSMSNR